MSNYDVAAYIWPSYHYEPRLEHFWPEKDGEWYTVRRATPRFDGHVMPRKPLLGYQDEADPAVMRQHVELAREHGINLFIMDWYWYENAPCLERQLNEALLPALEGTDSKFYLMWANHDATSLWDMHVDEQEKLWSGQVSRDILEPMFDRIIDKYLKRDSYYCIDNKPVFSIFQYPNLINGLGGKEQTLDAFDWMRRRCKANGLPGLHLQAIGQNPGKGLGGGPESEKPTDITPGLGFDSATFYQMCMISGGEGNYPEWAAEAISAWDIFDKAYTQFYPHVSAGWDNTHRHPSMKTAVKGANPQEFKKCLQQAQAYTDTHPDQPPLITINSWNEWTEGSYLLPDEEWGYGYLEAVRDVFLK